MSDGEWVATRHSELGFVIDLPGDLAVRENVAGAAIVASEPARPGFVAANVVVTVEQVGDEPRDDWLLRSAEAADQAAVRQILVDEEEADGVLHRWLRVYHHPDAGGAVLDQYARLHDGWGYVVSCTAGLLEYDDLADSFAHIAGSLVPGEIA